MTELTDKEAEVLARLDDPFDLCTDIIYNTGFQMLLSLIEKGYITDSWFEGILTEAGRAALRVYRGREAK